MGTVDSARGDFAGAAVNKKVQPTRSTVFIQPKTSSMRSRRRWLSAYPW